jgi:hypothetical protein
MSVWHRPTHWQAVCAGLLETISIKSFIIGRNRHWPLACWGTRA